MDKASQNKFLKAEILQKIIQDCNDPVLISDTKGKVIEANKALLNLFGYRPKGIINKNILSKKFLTVESLRQAKKTMAGLSRGKKFKAHNIQIKTKGGQIISVRSANVEPIKVGGKLIGFAGVFKDIAREEEAQNELIRAEEKYNRLINNINDIIFEIDTRGKFLFVSPQAEQLGLKAEKLINTNIVRIIHKKDFKKVWQAIRHYYRGGKPFPVEFRVIGGHRKIYWLEAEGRVHPGNKGKGASLTGVARDITDKKAAMAKLAESQEQYRMLAEQIRDIVYIADTNGKIKYISPRVKDFGFAPKQIIGKSILKYIHPKDKIRVLKEFVRALKTGEEFISEFRVVNPEGKIYWLEDNSRLRYDERGKPSETFGTLRDITERRQTAERFRKVAQVTSDFIYEWDVKSDHLEWFGDIDKALGYKPGEIPRDIQGWISKVHPEELSKMKSAVSIHRTSAEPINYEYRIHTKKGEWRWWQDRANPVLDDWGKPIRWIGACTDITEEKQFEEKLKKSEAIYRALFTDGNDAIFLADIATKRLIDCNDKALKLTGYTRDEILKMTALQLHPKDLVKKTMEGFRKQAAGQLEFIETEVLTKDKKRIPVEISSSPLDVEISGHRVLQGIFRDISDRRAAEIAMRREKERAEQYLDVAGVMILALDQNGKIILINKKGAEILEDKVKNITGKNWFNSYLPNDVVRKVKKIHAQVMGGSPKGVTEVTERIKTAKGNEKIISWINSSITDESGKIIGTLSSGLDITEKKLAQEKIAQREKEYRAIFESSPQVIMTLNKEGRVIDANNRVNELVGYEAKEYVGKKVYQLPGVPPESQKLLQKNFKLRLEGKAMPPYEIKLISKNGQIKWGQVYGTLVKGYGAIGSTVDLVSIVDVTERHHAEEALRRSQERYRGLVENSPDGIVIYNKDGRIIYSNAAGAILFGYKEADNLIGRSLYNHIPQADRGPTKQFIYAALVKGVKPPSGYIGERQIIRPDGTALNVEMNGSFVDFEGEKGIQVIVRDISEYKKAKKLIEESEKRYRSVVENANEAILVAQDGRIVFGNKKLTEMFGYTTEEFLAAETFAVFIHPEDRAMVADNYVRRIKGEKVKNLYDFRVIHKNGKTLWVRINAVLIDWEGRPATLNFLMDITERKEIEKRMIMMSQAIEQERDGVVVTDLSRNILYVNRSWEKIYSASVKEGESLEKYFNPADKKEYLQIIKMLDSQTSMIRGLKCQTTEGKRIPCLMTVTKLKDAVGNDFAILHTFQDIAEQEAYERSLKEANKKMTSALKEVEANRKKLEQQFEITRRMNRHMVGRELRMKELKARIQELEKGEK